MVLFLITCLVTAVSLLIISKLPLGIEIDSTGKAIVSGVVFGVLNALVHPVLKFLGPVNFLTLGLFGLVVNAVVFGLAAWLVTGFRLRWGVWSALLGTIVLSILNSLIFSIVSKVLPAAIR
jgi:putative membrane protein